MQNSNFLRHAAQIFAGIVALHVAVLAVLFSVGAGMSTFAGPSEPVVNFAKLVVFTGIVSLAGCCVTTQLYLRSKRNHD